MRYFIRLLGFVVCLGSFMPSYGHEKAKHTNQQLIVLLHGLADNAASFDIIKQKLQKTFPAASIVALTSSEYMLSATLSTKEQAKAAFKELATKTDAIQDKSIVLIGHSQGGMRAYALLKQYDTLLNVKGLITLATPWEGTPGARVDDNMLKQHLTEAVLNDLRILSLSFGYPEDRLVEQLNMIVQQNQKLCLFPGAKDLIVDSLFLNEIKSKLPHEKVPIWAIGGIQDDFGALLPKRIKHKFTSLNTMYTFCVIGENSLNNSYHDMKIPLYSQHAQNIVPKGKKNFKRIRVKSVFHSNAIWPALKVPLGRCMLSHPDVLRKIITCTKQAFSQK